MTETFTWYPASGRIEFAESEVIGAQRAPLCYFLGLDLGQAQDYTALAILERHGKKKEEHKFLCRHLHRWPLRTSYPAIVADVARLDRSEQLKQSTERAVLAVDATGVGAPVVDLLRQERLSARLEPIQITGGDTFSREPKVTRVPKRELVSACQVALQSDRLKIAPELELASVLMRELQNFKVKISLDTAHDSYGAWREGAHDDLVLAVALALWMGTHERPRAVCA